MTRLLFALVLALGFAGPAAARNYSQAELADFNIAGVKLGMPLDEAARVLKEHGYAGTIEAPAKISSFTHEGGAVVSVERAANGGAVAAVGLLQALPAEMPPGQLLSQIVPAMVKRFGEPTRRENSGAMTVLVYASGDAPDAGAISMTLRISPSGIDGRLGR